ncbi:MAG TPA: FkbM family methyltransferase [bacterium]|jgi:FkbM family methyltransferase|nr:FkbM family methyltransferase [bacterium]
MKINQILDLVKVLKDKEGRKAFSNWKPFSISSFYMARRIKNLGIPFKTIIDGGANIGQFSRSVAETFPEARVIAFEPLPDITEILKKNLSGSPKIKLIFSALGSKSGKITFHRNTHSHSSSVSSLNEKYQSSSALPFNKDYQKQFPEARNAGDVEVPLVTLDEVLEKETLEGPVLLKLDLQGFELEALRGGVKTLRKVDFILIETVFKPIYEGEALFPEIEDFLRSEGFQFVQVLDFYKNDQEEIVQIDALFQRSK